MKNYDAERASLLTKLDACNHAQAAARQAGKWDEYQEACEACMNLGRRLELLQIQQDAEKRGVIV